MNKNLHKCIHRASIKKIIVLNCLHTILACTPTPIHVCACMHSHTHAHTRVHVHSHIHAGTHTCTHACTHTNTCTHTHTHIHMHACVHTHTHIHTCAHTHTHTNTHALAWAHRRKEMGRGRRAKMKKTEFETGHNSEKSCSFLKGNQGNKASCTLLIGIDFKKMF